MTNKYKKYEYIVSKQTKNSELEKLAQVKVFYYVLPLSLYLSTSAILTNKYYRLFYEKQLNQLNLGNIIKNKYNYT